MIDLVYSLLPDLPQNLQWVYGVCYIVLFAFYFFLFLSPLYMIFSIKRKRR